MSKSQIYQQRTVKNYSLFEVSSAVQKAIRLGEEDTAMYFAVELFNSNFDEYLWKRLKLIVCEDIGLASPFLPATINSLYEMDLSQKKKSDAANAAKRPERLFLTQAILLMCRAKKSRLVDWTVMYYWREHDSRRMEIPDYAYDKHNPKGKSMGRGWKHFFEVGSQLNNHAVQEEEDARREQAWKLVQKEEGATLFDFESQPDEDLLND